jgi:hypothetical protein
LLYIFPLAANASGFVRCTDFLPLLKRSPCIQALWKEASKSMRSKSEPLLDDPRPLPLFRPEAVAAQQKKRYGDVLRIHPFSPTFFVVLIVVLFFCILGIYQFGRALL